VLNVYGFSPSEHFYNFNMYKKMLIASINIKFLRLFVFELGRKNKIVFPDYCVGILNFSKLHTRSNLYKFMIYLFDCNFILQAWIRNISIYLIKTLISAQPLAGR